MKFAKYFYDGSMDSRVKSLFISLLDTQRRISLSEKFIELFGDLVRTNECPAPFSTKDFLRNSGILRIESSDSRIHPLDCFARVRIFGIR